MGDAAEKVDVKFERLGAGCDAELFSEQRSELFVDAQRLGRVAGAGQRLHEVAVAALAIRGTGDQLVSGAFGGGEFGAPDLKAGVGVALERSQVESVELVADLVDPVGVLVG